MNPAGYGPRLTERPGGIGTAITVCVIGWLLVAAVALLRDAHIVDGRAIGGGLALIAAGGLAWQMGRVWHGRKESAR